MFLVNGQWVKEVNTRGLEVGTIIGAKVKAEAWEVTFVGGEKGTFTTHEEIDRSKKDRELLIIVSAKDITKYETYQIDKDKKFTRNSIISFEHVSTSEMPARVEVEKKETFFHKGRVGIHYNPKNGNVLASTEDERIERRAW